MRLLSLLLLAACFAAAQPRPVAVIAHRGEHQENPENTLAAIRGAIAAGADFVEIDVRTTRDGRFVLMHDRSVDRTTDGAGNVSDLTFVEIRRLDAGLKKSPQFTGEPVPTLDDALAAARGRIGVYVDAKEIRASDLVAALDRHAMRENVVVYGGLRFLAEVATAGSGIKVMPEAVNAAILRQVLDTLRPKVVAFGASDFHDELIHAAKQSGALVYVDRLGRHDTPEYWEDAIRRGADGIQTDDPARLVEYLRRR